MGVLLFILFLVLVIAIGAIAVWLWLFIGIVDQLAALVRIKVEEQVAIWRIEAIGRISAMSQRQLGDEQKPPKK